MWCEFYIKYYLEQLFHIYLFGLAALSNSLVTACPGSKAT